MLKIVIDVLRFMFKKVIEFFVDDFDSQGAERRKEASKEESEKGKMTDDSQTTENSMDYLTVQDDSQIEITTGKHVKTYCKGRTSFLTVKNCVVF